jgi:hypothetical protein
VRFHRRGFLGDLVHIDLHAVEIVEGLSEKIKIALDVAYKIIFNDFQIAAYIIFKIFNLSW